MGIHDGRELELLLAREKPLAVFSLMEGEDEKSCFHGQNFDQEVWRGSLCRFEKSFDFDENKKVVYIAFSLPDEAWRAHAYFHIKQFMYDRNWCSHLEWIEGSLLGYSDRENRDHLSKKYGHDGANDPC